MSETSVEYCFFKLTFFYAVEQQVYSAEKPKKRNISKRVDCLNLLLCFLEKLLHCTDSCFLG